MAVLQDILFGVTLKSILGDRAITIDSIAFDSRKVKSNSLFVAVSGLTVDGHDFIQSAIESGATGIICEKLPQEISSEVVYIEVDNSAKALGTCSANFYDRPSDKLQLIGVTGTNGKTTVATLCHDLFTELGYHAGLLSTVENRVGEEVSPSKYTTADALQINALLAEMVTAGCTHCFMEVSSHALVQHRTKGLNFKGGVFTNISHDHLDYHKSFDEYIAAKKLLFDGLSADAFALVNNDDRRGKIMLQNCKADKFRFGIKSIADYKAKVLHSSIQGQELEVDGINTWFRLVGGFNAYNLLAVFAIAILLDEDKMNVLEQLSAMTGAKGRFEPVENSHDILAIVDYAHTPDALENVLGTITDLRTKNENLVTVVGCGGNRDRDKRPKMANIASKYSDKVILTSDNPRDEDPATILEEMKVGIPKSNERNAMVILDRKEAIRTACNLVSSRDILLVAGKGHETYQEINGVRHHFDDREILKEMLS